MMIHAHHFSQKDLYICASEKLEPHRNAPGFDQDEADLVVFASEFIAPFQQKMQSALDWIQGGDKLAIISHER